MDVEIMLHGVPEGQDYYGIPEERANAVLFYDNSSESIKFVVEPKAIGNKPYVYYTYLRYKGLVGYGGRSGSYLGLTMRVDKYYQDVAHIYSMLEMVFKRYIVGVFIAPVGDSYKYLVPSFASKKTEIDKLQQGLIELIKSTCVWSKFVDLDSSFIHPGTSSASCNIVDITENAMLSALKKYSKVVLSPDYKLNLAIEYEKKIQEMEGMSGEVVAGHKQKLLDKEKEVDQLNMTINTQKSQIATLQAELRQKETEASQNKRKGELSQMILGIKEPVNSLANYFQVQDAHKEPPKPSYGRRNFILGILGCVLSAIIIALCIASMLRSTRDSDSQQNLSDLTQKNEQLANEIKLKNDTIYDLRNQLNTNVTKQQSLFSATPPNAVAVKNLRIDVSPYTGEGNLKCNSSYTLKVKNKDESNKDYTGVGQWTIKNATIKGGNDTAPKITIVPDGKGPVTMEYTSENCSCPSRTINVQTN